MLYLAQQVYPVIIVDNYTLDDDYKISLGGNGTVRV